MEINNKNIIREESDKTIRLTEGQSEAVKGLIQFFDSPYDENKRIYGLTGGPGVGKTFVTRYIVNKCKLPNSTIKCCSPTHKACRVLGQAVGMKADTIHSTFGFRLNVNLEDFDYNNPLFKPIASPKLENVKVLIIDEASMLNAGLVFYINKVCNENAVKILYIGDSSQLCPVGERRSNAFVSCVKVYELTEVVRQNDDNPIRELLNIIRNDIKNKTLNCLSFISTCNYPVYNDKGEGFSVINERQFVEIIKEKFNDEAYTKNIELYKTIAYTNLKVNYWNNIIRNTIIQDADKSFITKNDLIMAYETIVDEFMSPIISNSEEYIIKDMVNYTDDIFELLDLQDELQTMYTGGTVVHVFAGERLKSTTAMKNLVKKICSNYRLPYFTFSPTFSICPNHGYVKGEHFTCPDCGEDCEVYSRIVGYIRPVQQWNKGKKAEFKNRKTFVIDEARCECSL